MSYYIRPKSIQARPAAELHAFALILQIDEESLRTLNRHILDDMVANRNDDTGRRALIARRDRIRESVDRTAELLNQYEFFLHGGYSTKEAALKAAREQCGLKN